MMPGEDNATTEPQSFSGQFMSKPTQRATNLRIQEPAQHSLLRVHAVGGLHNDTAL